MSKSRLIASWTAYHEASKDYICDQCGCKIICTALYVRRVYVIKGETSKFSLNTHPDEFVIEREHVQPDCWENECWHK